MNERQFEILIQELEIIRNDIVQKLEMIRCGLIDVESEIQKALQQDSADTRHIQLTEILECTSCHATGQAEVFRR